VDGKIFAVSRQFGNFCNGYVRRPKSTKKATTNSIIFADGPFDIRDFITQQCNHDNIPVPAYFFRWVDIKKAYSRFYNCKPETITNMLDKLGMDFEGRAHSGLDDATNIYRIARHMFHKGYVLKKNSRHPMASVSIRKSRKDR
jgi:inhibitor of KinA sporulation pathway (predicted exonuclease)